MDQLAVIKEPFVGGISGGDHNDEQHKQAQIVYGLEGRNISVVKEKIQVIVAIEFSELIQYVK